MPDCFCTIPKYPEVYMGEISGSQAIARCLFNLGIKFIFTVATPRLQPLIRALHNLESIQIIEGNNETAVAIMADGYIRRSNCFAVVLTDKEGRALSQVVGISNAWADKIPLLSISICENGDVDFNKGVERNRFNQNGVFHAITNWRKRIDQITHIPKILKEAIDKSQIGKQGPVHLDIASSLLDQMIDERTIQLPETGAFVERMITSSRLEADENALKKAVSLLAKCKRPMLFCGAGVIGSNAFQEVDDLSTSFKIPAATSMAGVGCIPANHPYCIGSPAYTAGEVFNVAINEADVVIAIGVGFSGLDGFGLPPLWSDKIKFIHIDIDPLQIGLNISPEIPLLGDVKTVLTRLIELLQSEHELPLKNWSIWTNRLMRLKNKRKKRIDNFAERNWPYIYQGQIVKEISKDPEWENLLLVLDGGNTPLFSAMYAPYVKPRQVFYPYGMACLGCGLPYAIGIQLASPNKRVVLVTGDGSFLYNIQELETVRRLKLPITIVINNDSAWNMIRIMQYALFERRYVGTLLSDDIDYSKIAKGFDVNSHSITDVKQIYPVFKEEEKKKEPVVINCKTNSQNFPDCLLSFALVEFDGLIKLMNFKMFFRSVWMMKDLGVARIMFFLKYIVKALLRINF